MTVLNSGLPLSPSALRKLSRFRPAIFAISPIPRACNQPKGVAHEIRIRGFERRRDVCDLTFFRVEIVGGVKSGRLWHHNVSANNWARLMSPRSVRLSPHTTGRLAAQFGLANWPARPDWAVLPDDAIIPTKHKVQQREHCVW
jgi:hypothetical protein